MDIEWIKAHLERLEQHVVEIQVTLALNTQSLQEHMTRTANLEARVMPLEIHTAKFAGVTKAIAVGGGAIATGLGIIATTLKLLGKL